MKNKKILIQVNSISQFKKIIDFLQDDINIKFLEIIISSNTKSFMLRFLA